MKDADEEMLTQALKSLGLERTKENIERVKQLNFALIQSYSLKENPKKS